MKIILEKFGFSDFDLYYSLVQDHDVMRYVSGKGLSIEAARAKFDLIMMINSRDPALGYFKVYNSGKQYVGECKLVPYKEARPSLEIGYILKKEFWRQGYGTAICTELLALASRVAPEQDVIGVIDPENVSSRKLLEKFGFRSYFLGEEEQMATEKLIRLSVCRSSTTLNLYP